MILQLLVKGDAVGFKRYAKAGQDIEELVCVNPVSVKVKYAQGELIEARQIPEKTRRRAANPSHLPVEQVVHLKWDAPAFSPRGNSLVLPAFQSIELLRDYRRAEQAIAKRWATPFRLIKVGGAFGQKMVMPDQKMLEQVRDMVNKMDMKSGLVVPFYVTVETHGTDGQVLNVEDKVKEVKEDIVVALGLSRSLVTGDGPNFATASVSMQKMMVMIREIKQAARQLLDWIFDDWMELHGHERQELSSSSSTTSTPATPSISRNCSSNSTTASSSAAPACRSRWTWTRTSRPPTAKPRASTIDLMDEKQVKPVVDMVIAGILSVPRASKMLGHSGRGRRARRQRPRMVWSGDLASTGDRGHVRRVQSLHRWHQPLPGPQQRAHLRRPGLPLHRPPGVRLMPSDLKQRIQAATLKSLTARNRYTDQVTAQLTQALKQAEDEVARAILQYRSLGSLPDNKLAALKGLEKLQPKSTTP